MLLISHADLPAPAAAAHHTSTAQARPIITQSDTTEKHAISICANAAVGIWGCKADAVPGGRQCY